MKVKHGAKSLDAKLSQLQKTTKADWVSINNWTRLSQRS